MESLGGDVSGVIVQNLTSHLNALQGEGFSPV